MKAKNYKRDKNWEAVPGYEMLVAVLQDAHDQAAIGKGDERHANGLPFHEQRMQQISTQLDSDKGMAFQVSKKMTEGLQFDDDARREAELLGAINYLAGIVIYHRLRQPVTVTAAVEPNWPESAEARAFQIMQNGNEGEHYREALIGQRAAGGIIIGFEGDDAIIMCTAAYGSMSWDDAVKFCETFFLDENSDWRLPTKYQLNLAWVNREKLDDLNLVDDWYWSVSQNSAFNAWCLQPASGNQIYSPKNLSSSVRPVRTVKINDLEIIQPAKVES